MNSLMLVGINLYKVVMLLDSDIVVLLNELCKLSDVELKIVLVNSVYVKCLMKVMKGFGDMMLNG